MHADNDLIDRQSLDLSTVIELNSILYCVSLLIDDVKCLFHYYLVAPMVTVD